MKTSSFAKAVGCEKLPDYEALLYGENRYTVLRKAARDYCSLLGAGKKMEEVLSSVRTYLCTEYEELGFHYPWQAERYAADDLVKFERLSRWLVENFTLVRAGVVGSVSFPDREFPDGTSELTIKCQLVCKDRKSGRYHGLIFHPGKSRKSLKGRSNATNARFDLEPLVTKTSLEEEFPGIIIDCVYLSHDKDEVGNTAPAFDVSPTGSSNCHQIDYSDLYGKDNKFDMQKALLLITEAMTYVSAKCENCQYQSLCKSEGSAIPEQREEEVDESSTYRMPTYTKEQLEAIHHVNGPLRICAGPGSGKTATLVGRIKYLVEEIGIDPAFILVVVFANEAAEEIRDRCRSFLPEHNLPTISTLNGFAFKIIRDHAEKLGMKEIKVLTDKEQSHLIRSLLEVTPNPIRGFKYDKESGKLGLFSNMKKALEDYSAMDAELFFSKYPKLGEDFVDFADMFFNCIKYGDYISFDEQISLCNQLFREHPEVLKAYSMIHQYIMVDEFQDVNEEQMEMVKALANHGNIVVVGDDDQNLYKFRGADVRFLLEFDQYFPGAKSIVLRDNFRSTKSIVESSNVLINHNTERIAKDIRSGSGVNGNLPMVVRNTSNAMVAEQLRKMLEKGYEPEEIAILAFTNGTLEDLYDELTVPCYLAKSYLRHDGLYNFIHSVLKLFNTDMTDDTAFLTYLSIFGKTNLVRRESGLSLYEATSDYWGLSDVRNEKCVCTGELSYEWELLHLLVQLLRRGTEVTSFVKVCEFYLDWRKSNAASVILEQLEKAGITSMEGLSAYLDQVTEYEDATRVEVNGEGKVTLITSHDSKGKEWPVILFVNDMKDASETGRRLFYVSVTRAKREVVIFEEKNAKAPFTNELPHREAS